nr:ATP-binding protein [Pandoraea apista]
MPRKTRCGEGWRSPAYLGAEHMVKLFDRFYRAEPSRTNSRENHGLGLAIVKAIAEMHGGTVWARSEGGLNTFGFSVSTGRKSDAPPMDTGPSHNHDGATSQSSLVRQTP